MKWGERKNTWVCQRLSIYLFKEEMHCHFQALVETTHHLTLESILYLHTARPEQQEISHSMCKWTVGFTGDWTQLSFWEKPSQPIDRFSTEVLMWLCFCIFFTACGMESMQCCAGFQLQVTMCGMYNNVYTEYECAEVNFTALAKL